MVINTRSVELIDVCASHPPSLNLQMNSVIIQFVLDLQLYNVMFLGASSECPLSTKHTMDSS